MLGESEWKEYNHNHDGGLGLNNANLDVWDMRYHSLNAFDSTIRYKKGQTLLDSVLK